jgi:Putative prokaryotic signal transducing protein
MIELVRTNDVVLISFICALLKDADIEHFVADVHMSIFEGSLGIIPRRIMVDSDCETQARRLVKDAGIEHELRN